MSSCALSVIWLAGSWVYSTYLQPKVVAVEVSESRKELEDKHRKLLEKSGFKSDVNLKSVSDENLKAANRKLEKALRAGQ
jgi:D-ribose pyranose/furanose isomerase RbsD